MNYVFRVAVIFVMLVQINKATAQTGLYDVKERKSVLSSTNSAPDEFSRKRNQEFEHLACGNETDHERLYEMALHAQDSSPIYALGVLPNNRTADVLMAIVRKDRPVTAAAALKILAQMPTDLAAARIISLLDANTHSAGADKGALIACLKNHPCADTEQALIRLTDDPDVRNYALSALGIVGTARSLEALKPYAEHGTGTVQSISAYSMKTIAARIKDAAADDESERELAFAPFDLYQQAAQEVHVALSNAVSGRTTIEAEIFRARVEAGVREKMKNRGSAPVMIYPASQGESLAVYPPSPHNTEVMQGIRGRIDEIEAQLSKIQLQAMQVSAVRDAMIKYEQILRSKMMGLDPQAAEAIRVANLKDGTRQPLIFQAQLDPDVKQQEELAKKLMINAMQHIDPNAQSLWQELNGLITRYLEMQSRNP